MKGSTTPQKPSTSSIAAYSTTRNRQNEVYEDYSEAVENWRQKRENKRKQSVNSNPTEDDLPISVSNIILSPPKPKPIEKFNEPETKPTLPPPSTRHLVISNRTKSKSPSPQRIRGPAKFHEITIQKPIEIRGFGFKLDGGPAQNRPIYISTLEDGSPADKAGLCVDDEVISMNDENIEKMSFDQVRKILKERNLRGSIKMVVKTYEDPIDDKSQSITIERSRTPSPQKSLSNSHAPASTIHLPSTTPPPTIQSPVYTFLPYTPPPSSIPITNISVHQTPAPSLNIFAPKPFRSTASISLDSQNNNETTTANTEQQSSTISKPLSRDIVNTLLSNPLLISSNILDPPSPATTNSKPPPLTSVESLLHGTLDINNNDQKSNESPIAQVRSSVEKQMNQLQQDLLLGFPHTQTTREQRPVNIPIDLTNASTTHSPLIKSTSQQDTNSNRIFENAIRNSQQLLSSHGKQSVQDNRPSTAHSTDRTVNELKVNLSSPASFQQQNKVSLQIDENSPQKYVSSKQLHATLNQAPKQTHYDDHSWIADDQRRPTVVPPPPPSSQLSSYNNNNGRNGSGRRSASLTPRHHDLQTNKQSSNQITMFHYGDHIDESHYQHQSRSAHEQQKDFDPSINHHHQSKHRVKSPIRTTINSNNNRVLSVSGKLRCSRCNDELGQGSAMVIESLGLYYHIECFRCFVCNIPLSSSFEGTDVRVRSNRLHCQNCFSDENGAWRSNV